MEAGFSLSSLGEPSAALAVTWTALVRAAGASVMVLASNGRIEYANGIIQDPSVTDTQDWIGYNLTDCYPPATALEMVFNARSAVQRGRPVHMLGMYWGVLRHTWLFAVGDDAESAKLTVVSTALSRDAARQLDEADDLIISQHMHLGMLAKLSDREFEVLRLLGKGFSTGEVARQMHRSIKTIEGHRAALGAKLNVENRVQLAEIAMNSGLVYLSEKMMEELMLALPKRGRDETGGSSASKKPAKKRRQLDPDSV